MKTSQHNMKNKKSSKSRDPLPLSTGEWDGYKSESMIMRLGEDLLLMIKEDQKMVTLGPWIERHNLSYSTMDGWRERFPKFNEMYQQAKKRLGNRVFEKAFYKEGDSNMARFSLANYDPEFKSLEEWRIKLRQESKPQDDSYVRVVYVPTFNESGRVPSKTLQDTNE